MMRAVGDVRDFVLIEYDGDTTWSELSLRLKQPWLGGFWITRELAT
jgi:hypothetical protein